MLRAFDPTLDGAGVWLVIPCFRVKDHILSVIAKTPGWVDGIVCVDDAWPGLVRRYTVELRPRRNTRVVVVRLGAEGERRWRPSRG